MQHLCQHRWFLNLPSHSLIATAVSAQHTLTLTPPLNSLTAPPVCTQVVPGEGAHATFAPRGWRQMALTAYVTARIGHCEIEEVACGRGLELIYEFLMSDPTVK